VLRKKSKKHFMKNTLIALSCITTLLCSAQSTDKKFMVKLYSGYESVYSQEKLFNATGNYYSYKTTINQEVLPLAPAFAWFNSKGNSHEIELANVEWKRDFSENKIEKVAGITQITKGSNIYSNTYGVKYKFTQYLFQSKSWKIKPFVGYGALVKATYLAIRPLTSSNESTDETHVNAYMQVEPGFEYSFYKNFNINLSLPLTFASLDAEHFLNNDPSLPENLKSTGELSLNFFPNFYQLKLALGYKF
jgi:hypothetical protein